MSRLKYIICPQCKYEDSSILSDHNDGNATCPQCQYQGMFKEEWGNFGQSMTIEEYTTLLKFIYDNHGWATSLQKLNSKHIKYVRCNYDTRTNDIYGITLDKIGFYITNQNRHKNLKDWVMKYLNTPNEEMEVHIFENHFN